MTTLKALIKRNIKLSFKDKGLFFTALITPLILLVLYTTFLSDVFRDSLLSSLPKEVYLPEKVINGYVGGQLTSSILAVACVTVAFCLNMLSVQDKVNGSLKDMTVSPLESNVLTLSYYISSYISTLIICLIAAAACLIYVAAVGFYLSLGDVLLILLDILLLVLFGTALSSVINVFISTQGQISAVGSIVSSGYGFLCGAYMPISQFSPVLQKVISFLPGTYATALLRNHCMRGVFAEMESYGLPKDVIRELMNVIDCNLYFFEAEVSIPIMYAVLSLSVAALLLIYLKVSKKNIK